MTDTKTIANPLRLRNRRPRFESGSGDDVRWGFDRAIRLATDRARATGTRQVVTATYNDAEIAALGAVLRRAFTVQAWR